MPNGTSGSGLTSGNGCLSGGNEVDLDSRLNHMTTLIVTETPQGTSQGSGFFYSVSDHPDP